MKPLYLLALLSLACSPESLVTPDECKIEQVKRVETMTIGIGDTVSTRASYRVTLGDGRVIEVSEAEAIKAQGDPVAACEEWRKR